MHGGAVMGCAVFPGTSGSRDLLVVGVSCGCPFLDSVQAQAPEMDTRSSHLPRDLAPIRSMQGNAFFAVYHYLNQVGAIRIQ